jgi:hypothetical protein
MGQITPGMGRVMTCRWPDDRVLAIVQTARAFSVVAALAQLRGGVRFLDLRLALKRNPSRHSSQCHVIVRASALSIKKSAAWIGCPFKAFHANLPPTYLTRCAQSST